MNYLPILAIALTVCAANISIAQSPSAYERGLTVAREGKFQAAAEILSAVPNSARSATHHYLLAVCYAKLEQSDLALPSAESSLQDISNLPSDLRPDAISLLKWAAFSEGTRKLKVSSVLERFKMSAGDSSTHIELLEQEGNAGRETELLAIRKRLEPVSGLVPLFKDIDRARSCQNWANEQILTSDGLLVSAVDCTTGGQVAVVYGGALRALIDSYGIKRLSLTLP